MNNWKRMQKTYSTKELANIVGVHVNTLRFYEKIGFLTKPERKGNGYRIYTDLHLEQCKVIRLAMKAEVLQNGLRKKAVEIVQLCAEKRFDDSIAASKEYLTMIENEMAGAQRAIIAVEGMLSHNEVKTVSALGRKEAAKILHVTPETLRTWERNGLISMEKQNGYRCYSQSDMERLNIIRTLRLANYSLSAILRLMKVLDSSSNESVESLLNNPAPDEDIVSVCDKLIHSLQGVAFDARKLTVMMNQMKKDFSTLQ